jgi:hypothetical protein
MSQRPLDHLVLPVTDIATARARLSALGFTVAADGRHPFGTENCCLYFADKTFIEPLGVASAEECAGAIRAGNQFVARNAAFRFRRGNEGLSAIVMGASDADADHAAFRAEGLSGGDMLTFSRQMVFPDGSQAEAGFKLAFAADLRAPDFFAFSCQRINVPAADRSALERHANGVKGISKIVLSADDPHAFAAMMTTVSGAAPASPDGDLAFALPSADIDILTPAALAATYGYELAAERGLFGEAIVFAVDSLAAAEALLEANSVTYHRKDASLIVPPRAGQGVLFAFSEE